ncbi:Putative peptidoglycan binding domain-containing protein [Altererythrobacter xiamenensis]|uniref:Putative peptidoglycan binding domain-containing protein n=1 Tax=Altererythrobacter xiamenensis TaxID=1316679 RepID=A0A1Y6FH61_9SPHN|nr:L,D-transpeptidase family protein [Altererythrobacter xiamenensis]SMQ74328.1 Putative peptidoglycan binding domain-containing protein [Altererythrobacter xiamenensis]
MRFILTTGLALVLAACGANDAEGDAERQASAADQVVNRDNGNLADSMASNDPGAGETTKETIADSEERPIMQLQVVLDRRGFGPGVIDGKMGMSTENALRGFQEANGLEVTGKHDEATKQALAQSDGIAATRVVTVPQDWSAKDYTDIPEETAEKAELDRLDYTSLDERLAERFHTTLEVLKRLNPDGRPAGASAPDETAEQASDDSGTTEEATDGQQSYFTAGQQIRVPNIGADRIAPGAVDDSGWQQTLASLGVGTEQPEVDRIVVSKVGKTLKAFKGDKLVALFTVSSGSSQFPLPLGEWDILGEAYNPPYSYDPEVLGQGDGETYKLPPGPNCPVGVVWIDLSKEHYGIHGTPEPETIGRAQSSGCVRLTNWDAARLAEMVSQKTRVEFVA